jgi:hypothetical protein
MGPNELCEFDTVDQGNINGKEVRYIQGFRTILCITGIACAQRLQHIARNSPDKSLSFATRNLISDRYPSLMTELAKPRHCVVQVGEP